MSIEERLRQSLQARAADVRPDPELWSTVQSRIRRGRRFRLALAGATAALMVAAVAIAAPGVINRRIEFEPGPVATAPPAETEPTQGAGGPVPDMVFTDGEAVYRTGADREPPEEVIGTDCPENADCDIEPVRSVAAQPQADDALAAVAARGCAGLQYTGGTTSFMPDTCPASVAFSPDGGHLAWVGQAGPDGDWLLHTVDWADEGPGEDTASFGSPWGVDREVDIQDWVWESQTLDGDTGYLVLRTQMDNGPVLMQWPIERQADGAIAVTGDPGAMSSPEALTPIAFASAGGDVSYIIEVDQRPSRIEGQIVRESGGAPTTSYDLPPELFSNTNRPFDAGDIWITASGDTVVYGNAGTRMAWSLDWSADERRPVNLEDSGELLSVVDADLLTPAEVADEQPPSLSQVDVYFGMTGADACVADQTVQREVVGAGVARGAVTELLKGPSSRESNEGVVSPFDADTAGALNDIAIVDGEARVDFADFSDAVDSDSCTKSAILDSLEKTLRQFPTVVSTRYSFDGDVQAWTTWLGSPGEAVGGMPPAVAETADRIRTAAAGHDWKALRRLSRETSCTLSDQKEPCVPVWKDQEANGADPLGTMVDLLSEAGTRDGDAPMWVWPEEWAAPNADYSGPRIGIDSDGVWRYFVLEGG